MCTLPTGVVIGVAVLLLGISGCSSVPVNVAAEVAVGAPAAMPADHATTPALGTDRTVHSAGSWSAPDSGAKVSHGSGIVEFVGSSSITAIAAHSDLAVRGTVTAVSYTHVDGQPYTLSDVKVSEVLAGDAKVGDLITIVQPGGYIPLRIELATGQIDRSRVDPSLTQAEIDASYNAYHWDGQRFPEVGDDSIYFLTELTKTKAKSVVGSTSLVGAYFRGWSDAGQFRATERNGGEAFIRHVDPAEVVPGDPDTGATISVTRLREVAQQIQS